MMMNILLRAALVLALTAAVGCDRSPDTDEQANGPAATLADSDTIDETSVSAATAGQEGDSVEELPPTASPLPLALSIACASLGGAFVVRIVRRRVR